jgi:hypothetical protein
MLISQKVHRIDLISNKHILAEYDEKICFEDRAEFHPSWPYSFAFASENFGKI